MSAVAENWDTRIARCHQLAQDSPPTTELLTFYATVLEAQKQIYDSLRVLGPVAYNLELREYLHALLQAVKSSGPPALVDQATTLMSASRETIDEMLSDYWQNRSDKQFFAKALLQPYAQQLAESRATPLNSSLPRRENQCPFCSGKPQVSFLKITESGSESGNRNLLCATCLSAWEFRRVVCASCGEERPFQLSYYQTDEYEHVRIEACDSCKQYIKGVDLTRLGYAVPLVDDVATAALDLWAVEHGYTKIELNLIGL